MARYIRLNDFYGSVDLADELPGEIYFSILGQMDRFWKQEHIFRNDGMRLSTVVNERLIPRYSLWTRILAHTIHNPSRPFRVKYQEAGAYDISEIKNKLLQYVAADDDDLTQFMHAADISDSLDRSNSFDDIVDLIEQVKGRGEGTLRAGYAAISKSLRALLTRTNSDAFVIIEEPMGNVVQFIGSRSEPLVIDVPTEALSREAKDHAQRLFTSLGGRFFENQPMYDRVGGTIVGTREVFQMELNTDVRHATNVALRVLREVFRLPDTARLIITEN
ncbi:MAG: hypothetical protein K8T91_24420 [Planctomycetes bacterium]|nr:hypothetical protein [Planctomycetota bacterium]